MPAPCGDAPPQDRGRLRTLSTHLLAYRTIFCVPTFTTAQIDLLIYIIEAEISFLISKIPSKSAWDLSESATSHIVICLAESYYFFHRNSSERQLLKRYIYLYKNNLFLYVIYFIDTETIFLISPVQFIYHSNKPDKSMFVWCKSVNSFARGAVAVVGIEIDRTPRAIRW